MEAPATSCSSVGPGEALHAVKKSTLNATDETTDDSNLPESNLPIPNLSLRSKASEKDFPTSPPDLADPNLASGSAPFSIPNSKSSLTMGNTYSMQDEREHTSLTTSARERVIAYLIRWDFVRLTT